MSARDGARGLMSTCCCRRVRLRRGESPQNGTALPDGGAAGWGCFVDRPGLPAALGAGVGAVAGTGTLAVGGAPGSGDEALAISFFASAFLASFFASVRPAS